MKRCKNAFLIFSLVGAMVLSMTACSNGSSNGNEDLISKKESKEETEKTDKTKETEKTEKTKLVFLRAGTEESKKNAFLEIIDKFEEAYPDYTVEYQEAPWGNDMETKLNTGFASGTAPDVINFSLGSIAGHVAVGHYGKLNEYVKDWEGKDDYYPSLLKAGSIGDDLYGLAIYPDARTLLYNTELFEKAGLDPNKTPSNWKELKEYHEKLVVRDDDGNVIQTGFGFPTSGHNIDSWLQIFAMQNGLDGLIDESTNEIKFNEPEAIEAMNFLKELNEIGTIPWDWSQLDQDPFKNGTAAMTIQNENSMLAYNTGDLEGKIKMAPMFSNKKEATFCGMHFLFMGADSKHKDGAWEFMKFLTSKESLKIWMKEVGCAPVRKSLKEAYLENDPGYRQYILDAVEIGRGAPKITTITKYLEVLEEAMEKVFYGTADTEEAFREAEVKLQKEIDEQ